MALRSEAARESAVDDRAVLFRALASTTVLRRDQQQTLQNASSRFSDRHDSSLPPKSSLVLITGLGAANLNERPLFRAFPRPLYVRYVGGGGYPRSTGGWTLFGPPQQAREAWPSADRQRPMFKLQTRFTEREWGHGTGPNFLLQHSAVFSRAFMWWRLVARRG